MKSATPNGFPENVRVEPIVIPELKFGDVERQIFAAVPMPVLGFATDESFVHFHNANEFTEVLVDQASPDAVAHIAVSIKEETIDQPFLILNKAYVVELAEL